MNGFRDPRISHLLPVESLNDAFSGFLGTFYAAGFPLGSEEWGSCSGVDLYF